MNITAETTAWFELLETVIAKYVSDTVTEVYAADAGAPHFARIVEVEGGFEVTLLTSDRAELIVGEASLSGMSARQVAGIVEAMV